jgi:UPF0755 protein
MKFFKNKPLKQRSRLKTFLLVFGLSLIFIGCATGGALKYWYQTNLKAVSQQSAKVLVVIPSGYSAEQIANLLHSQGLIKNTTVFELYVRFAHLRDSLKAGEYQLDPSLSVQQIVDILNGGQVYTELFTILPAKRLDQIRQSFITAGFTESDVDAALNPANYVNYPALVDKPAGATLEGYLYPESYQITATTTVAEIVGQALNQMDAALTDEIVAGFAAQGLNVHQGVTLASIVEQEASSAADRQMVAGVFLNRLAIGMALGSDVTYHYAADVTGQEATPFIDSPYNTRKYTGLPPGPISNVSASSLQAVANPTPSEYLFFVAGDPVGDAPSIIYYSKTQAEHEAYASQYCHTLCSTY